MRDLITPYQPELNTELDGYLALENSAEETVDTQTAAFKNIYLQIILTRIMLLRSSIIILCTSICID
jgi:hypothetical protein